MEAADTPGTHAPLSDWHAAHRPLHWFAEFYGTMRRGGFDVVVGNPPWKELSALKREKSYTPRGYATEKAGNLYGLFTELALQLTAPHGATAFIVQLPLACSSRMKPVRKALRAKAGHLTVLTLADRPARLFEGLENCRSTIFMHRGGSEAGLEVTRYLRWPSDYRPHLLDTAALADAAGGIEPFADLFPKVHPAAVSILQKVAAADATLGSKQTVKGPHRVFYQEAVQYWMKVTLGPPFYEKDGVQGEPGHSRTLDFADAGPAAASLAVMYSSLFYLYFIAFGDGFHQSAKLTEQFPIPFDLLKDTALQELGDTLDQDLKDGAGRKTIKSRGSKITYAEFFAADHKPTMDRIDDRLAAHYGFTPEELETVKTFDLKFRTGGGDY